MLRRWETSQAFHKHLPHVAQRLLTCVSHQRWARITATVNQTHWFLGEHLNGGLSSSGSLPSVSASIPPCSPTTALRGNTALRLNGVQAPSCSRKHLRTLEALSLHHLALGRQEACDWAENQTLLQPPPSEHHVTPSGLCLLVQVQVLTDPMWQVTLWDFSKELSISVGLWSPSIVPVWSLPETAGRTSILFKPSPN